MHLEKDPEKRRNSAETSEQSKALSSSQAMAGKEVVTLESLRKKMADFARERDWEQFHSPRNLLLALVLSSPSLKISLSLSLFFFWFVGEVGELSEIFQWKGEVAKGLPDWGEEEKQHLGEELSDVLLYLVRLSDMCGVDLGEAALRKLDLNAAKYPVHLCKASSMKRTYNSSGANENPQSGGAPEGSEL
ncbi:hypothetical protein ZIOFF_064518 [Zingiber officinale]|uniref:dCTP pyrophosphatase 1 n=1 Tax=Zingiber officinale TaxID=94328 RepID=A0A8J5EW68_ZINOF|nr:hypothetical protein ZIOFF_064518 [Zingiber officinale]